MKIAKVKYWICNKLAKFLLMENPKQIQDEQEANEKISQQLEKNSMERSYSTKSHGSYSDVNTLNSKSLLANVLDINDNYGVMGNGHTFFVNKNSQRRIKAKLLNDHQNAMTLKNYDSSTQQFRQGYKRDNSAEGFDDASSFK